MEKPAIRGIWTVPAMGTPPRLTVVATDPALALAEVLGIQQVLRLPPTEVEIAPTLANGQDSA